MGWGAGAGAFLALGLFSPGIPGASAGLTTIMRAEPLVAELLGVGAAGPRDGFTRPLGGPQPFLFLAGTALANRPKGGGFPDSPGLPRSGLKLAATFSPQGAPAGHPRMGDDRPGGGADHPTGEVSVSPAQASRTPHGNVRFMLHLSSCCVERFCGGKGPGASPGEKAPVPPAPAPPNPVGVQVIAPLGVDESSTYRELGRGPGGWGNRVPPAPPRSGGAASDRPHRLKRIESMMPWSAARCCWNWLGSEAAMKL